MNTFLNRRTFLQQTVHGLSSIALLDLLSRDQLLAASGPIRPIIDPARPFAARKPHFAPKAKRVVMVFCSSALSHVDTFDYKPALFKYHDQPMPGGNVVTFQGEQGNLIKPLRDFKPRGQSGKMTSDLLPKLGSCADDFFFFHGMTSKTNTHGPGETFMSTGQTLEGFPSAGAWVNYALGTENENLPSYIAIPDPRGNPQAAGNNWSSAFLPAAYQGTAFNAENPIRFLARPNGVSASTDKATADFLKRLNERHLEKFPGDSELAARIASYELAAKMQMTVPSLTDLSSEPAHVLKMYGADDPTNAVKAGYAAVKGVKPGFIKHTVEHLLPEFAEKLDPVWADAVKTSAPGNFMVSNKGRVADALLAVTDARAPGWPR